ncbi:MAG: diguanylate cyclase [Rubrivivax sp.]|jgi:diguanylate cyclase (GGDEF)-like protein/PAS domain S-box-containing protein|nr:diguanylate cyclase [Rubrivivax sp.]
MTPPLQASAPRSALWIAGLALLYGLASVASLLLAARPGQIATLWFANPLGTVALLALPRRQWPLMLIGLGLANLLANVVVNLPSQALDVQAWRSAAAFVPGNCAEILLAAWLLVRVGVRAQDLLHPARLAVLFGAGVLVPTLLSALAGAALVARPAPDDFARVWATWLAGGLIGSVAVLPLALTVWLRGPRHLLQALNSPLHLGLLVLAVAITLLAATTLTQPFVVIAMALGLLAAVSGLTVTALGCLVVAVLIGLLIGSGILLLPPSAAWWGDSLYYGAVLATLLPGIFLAATVDSRRDTLQRLSASEARLRSLYTQTPAMLHSLDATGRIINVSQQWLKTLGFAEHEVLGRPVTDFLTPDSARLAAYLIDPSRLDDGRVTVSELQMVRADGGLLDVVVSAIWEHDGTGRAVRRLAVVEDVTEKKRLAALSHFAEHDALTGLPNRVLLQDRLERACVQHARHGGQFALAFLDLDHFKAINDTHGHDTGDALLKAVAQRLQDSLRASDTVCRLGGDEFVLLLTDLDGVAQAQALAQKVLGHVTQPCLLGDGDEAVMVDVGCSMGLAIFPQHGQDPAALLLHADQAMYTAKRSGRNRWVVYAPEGRA